MALLDQFGRPLTAHDAGPTAVPTQRLPRLVNPRTGMGGAADRQLGTDFAAVRLTPEAAQRIFQMSWVAHRLVTCIVDDMFAAGRSWTGDDEGANQAMEEAEADLRLWERLPAAMIIARIFGTGILLVCTDKDEFDKPLKPADVREGSLTNLVAIDRWSLGLHTWHQDLTKPRYGEPYQYRWNRRAHGLPGPKDSVDQRQTSQVVINTDRCFRFDGIKPPMTDGWRSGPWEREWGVSILTRALDDLLRDAEMAHGMGQLVTEASIWVHKVEGYREALARGVTEKGDVSVEDLAAAINEKRSIYRSLFIDAQDEAGREDVTWAGLPDVTQAQLQRICAIEGIPITRFLGTSATGLSATGDGDARDWRITVEAFRRKHLDPILTRRLDVMIARHAGLSEPPKWEWNKLGEMTEAEKAEVTSKLSKAVVEVLGAGAIDEEEARERLSKDDFWGPFGEFTPSLETELEISNQMAAQEREKEKLQQSKEQAENANAIARQRANGQAGPPQGAPS